MIDSRLLWAGTALWVVLWAVFVARLAWLDARLRAHLTKHHAHRWRRLPWTERLTWSVWFVFRSQDDYGDPAIRAQRGEMLTVFFAVSRGWNLPRLRKTCAVGGAHLN